MLAAGLEYYGQLCEAGLPDQGLFDAVVTAIPTGSAASSS